ncbi:MAG: hypothetical protein U1F81_08680 [Verrucomicrobiaceae bacterium]
MKKNEEDAGKSQFGIDTPPAFEALRMRLGAYLDAKSPAPKDRWHDPRPGRPDLSKARQIMPLAH